MAEHELYGQLPIDDVTGLQVALDAKAADAAVVHNTGNETINGTKIFGSPPQVPQGTQLTHPLRRDDPRIAADAAATQASVRTIGTGALQAAAGTAPAAAVTAHEGATDPHGQYLNAARAAAAYQPLDSDLTALAALAPADGSIPRRIAGAWSTSTIAEIKTALALAKGDVGLGNVANLAPADLPLSTAATSALAAKADLVGGLVPASQLPAYVDDVLEYAALANFPATGESGKIYTATGTGRIYRWGGSAYVEISASPGSTDAVPEGASNLYFTPGRASAAAPVQSVAGRSGAVVLTKGDVGLGNVDNTADSAKPVSTAQQAALDGKQPLDADLTTIAGLTATTDHLLQSVAGAWAARTPAQVKATLALIKGDVGLGNVDNTSDSAKPVSTAQQSALDGKQGLDAQLTALAALAAGADQLPYFTGTAAAAQTPLTSFARTLLDDADAATMRNTIGAAGGLVPTATKTGAYTAAFGELVMVDASAGPIVITMPVLTANGQRVAVKKIDSSANVVTVAAGAGNTIGSAGAASVPVRLQDQAVTYQGNGTNWVIPHSHLSLPSLDARFVSPTLAAAQGDLLAASGAGVLARLPVGADGQTIIADPTQALGLRWGAVPTPTVVPPGPSPASILNIGPRPGQNHFNWQLARLGDGAFFTKTVAEIAAGYEESPIFVGTADKEWVVCRVSVGAPTTGGSSFARAEGREQNESGGDVVFDATDANTHRASGRFRIVKAPAVNPDIVCVQTHNGSVDRIAIRTQLVSGTWRLRIRFNGSTVTLDGGGTDVAVGIANIQGLDWDWKIETVNGVPKVWLGLSTDPNALVVPKYTGSTAFTSTGGATWYHKTGCYLQTNVANGDTASDYGEVWVHRSLSHWHTGWATPAPFYATAKHAASHAAGAYDAITPAMINAAPRYRPQRTITASETLLATDDIVLVNSAAATITATLPSAVGIAGESITVKKTGAFPVVIATTGGQTVDGAASETISVTNGFRTLVSDGANWLVIGGRVDPVIAALSDVAAGGTLTINAAAANVYRARLMGSTATLAAPTNPIDGDVVNIELYPTVACTLAVQAAIVPTGGLATSIPLAVGKLWSAALRYRGATTPATSAAAWRLLASSADN